MATIDIKAKPPLLTPDWTQMDGRNKPFLMDNPRRYCVTVVTQENIIGGKAEQIKDSAKPSGVNHILKYFDKEMSDDALAQAVAEDYYLPLRPNAKVKVLVSLPESYLLSLEEAAYEPPNLSNSTIISLNTFGINSDINNVNQFMTKYIEDIERFQGKLYGLDITKQASFLSEFIVNLSSLMLDNDIQFSSDKSDLVEIYIDNDYNILKLDVRQDLETSSRPTNMTKSFSSFLNKAAVKDKRTIKLLEELENILQLQSSDTRVSWTKFIEDYIYNPPKFDFSATRPKSKNPNSENVKAIEKDNNTPVKTEEQVATMSRNLESPDFKKDLENKLDTAQDFVGDYLVSNLSQLSTVINDAEVLYTQVLNKLGIQDLVRSALECFNIANFEFLDIAKVSIETATNISRQFQATLSVPTISFPSGAQIVDLLKDVSLEFAKTIANAVIGALIDLVINTLKSLFDICKECGLEGLDSPGVLAADGVNYGGLNWKDLSGFNEEFSKKALNTSLGAVIEGSSQFFDTETLSQEVLTVTIQKYDELVDETANKLVEASKTGLTFEEAKKIVIEQNPFNGGFFGQASDELTRWLDATSAVMTPGEMGNLLLGCQVSTEAQEVLNNLLDPVTFPALSVVLDPSDLPKVWENLGKLVNRDNILESVQEAAKAIPDSFKCLCDADDQALRKRILSSKDPSLTPDELQKQIDNSNARRRNRINQLLNISENPDFMKDILPPLYCKMDEDGNIIPGIIPRTHPVLQSAINQSLDATFDSLTTIFNDDIKKYVSSLSVDTISRKVVPRTKKAKITLEDGSSINERVINPEFARLVEEGRFSWGSLPAGAEIPGSRPEPKNDTDELPEGTKIKYSPFLYSLGFSSWGNRNGAGMWESGQTRPTAEQEYRWELANLSASGFGSEDFKVEGGRRFSSDPNNKTRNGGVDDIEYTRTFGYSPIPIEVSERGDRVFAPGMREAFIKLCSGSVRYLTVEELPQTNKEYSFKIPNNIANNSGADMKVIRENLSKVSGEITRIESSQGNRELDSKTVDTIKQSLDMITGLEFDFSYNVPYQLNGQQISSSDIYNINIGIIGPSDFSASVAEISSSVDIPVNALNLIDQLDRVDYGDGKAQPQEGYFYNLLVDKYKEFNPTFDISDYFTKLKSNQSYDGAFDDFICTISDQISDSPYLGLEEVSKINFTPAKTFVLDSETNTWVPQSCTPSLLDISIIKDRIMDEYSLSLCMKELYQDVNEFGGNEQDSYQVAKRSGIILLTMRVYVLEFLLRTIFSFHYFGFREEKDIDDTMVEFLFDIFDKNLTARSIGTAYRPKFQKETIELYNRNVPNSEKVPELQEDSYKIAAKKLLKGQILSVSKRLSRLVKQKGDASIHSILLEEWLPLLKIPTADNQSRFYRKGSAANEFEPNPLKSMVESGEIFIPSEDLFKSITTPGGTLTDETIKRMSGNPGSYGVLYLKPVGQFFREYFKPNDDNRKLASRNFTGPEDQNNIPFKTNEIWPDRIKQVQGTPFNRYRINRGNVFAQIARGQTQQDTYGREVTGEEYQYLSREAVLLGVTKPIKFRVPLPFSEEGKTDTITPGQVSSLIYFAEEEDRDKSYIFDFGVSESEKQMMTGSGGIIDILSAARSWTLTEERGTRNRGTNPDFVIIGDSSQGETHPWFPPSFISREQARQEQYYPFRNVAGPGSFLHAVTSQLSPFDNILKLAIPDQRSIDIEKISLDWLEDWKSYVLSPEQNNGRNLIDANSDWTRNIENAIKDISKDRINKTYISLMDLDLRMIRNTLKWEQSKYQKIVDDGQFTLPFNGPTTNYPSIILTQAQISWYEQIILKYNDWIAAMDNNILLSTQAQKEREELSKPVTDLLSTSRVPRNDLKKADKLYDISNGNFFQEFYIRVEDYGETDQLKPPSNNLDYVSDRDGYLKNVVDINHFDDYVSRKFSTSYPAGRRPLLINEITLEECADNLANDPNIRTKTRPQTGDSRLNDFFKSLKFGMRISYLPPPKAQAGEDTDPELSKKEKTYYLKDAGAIKVTPIPLVSVETPINMNTKIKEVIAPKTLPSPTDIENGVPSKYFNWLFKTPQTAGQANTIPREILMNNIRNTNEYEFLFRYSFSLDRMLSLTNMYSYSYLLTLPNVSNTFDPTKEKLMYDFLYSLRAGDYRAADCVNSNFDISNALENGIPIPYAAIAKLLVRTPLLIFKGFVEQSSLNVAFSKQIRESIKAINQIIANAQRQANAIQAAGASIGAAASALSNISVDNTNCGFGINSPQATVKPPEKWFDPVNEKFIPVPETWMIGISLLPSDIFLFSPMPPVGYTTGLPYWVLDDGLINPAGPWLGELPVEDYVQKMLNGRNEEDTSKEVAPTDDCVIDVGLLPPGNIHNNNK
jgi:hypothetical protein